MADAKLCFLFFNALMYSELFSFFLFFYVLMFGRVLFCFVFFHTRIISSDCSPLSRGTWASAYWTRGRQGLPNPSILFHRNPGVSRSGQFSLS